MNPYKASKPLAGESLQEFAKRMLRYDAETGKFFWRETRNGRAVAGSEAGSPNQDGYTAIRLEARVYLAHRLAWMFVHGAIDAGVEVDHKNGLRADNRIKNLRLADNACNAQNLRSATSRSRVGLLGVVAEGRRFRAFICAGRKKMALGTYDTAEEAHAAYVQAKRSLHPGGLL